MLYIVIWFVLALVVGALADARDRSGLGWFLLALVLSPLLAGLFLLLAGENRPARCPYCDERIKAAAKICPHCRSDLAPGGAIVTEDGRRLC